MNEPNEADQALCVAYAEGLLSPGEQLAFEMRLASEPELARALERMIATDEVVRRAWPTVRVERPSVRPRSLAWGLALAAAAAVLLVFLYVSRPRSFGPDGPGFEVAVVAGHESALEYIDSLPELRGLRPPGIGAVRGESAAPNIDAEEFLARASQREIALVRDGGASETRAGYFVIPLSVARLSGVVVYAYPRVGEPRKLFPTDAGSRSVMGESLLPGYRFRRAADASGRVRYERGFLVPVGALELDLVVAVIPERDSGSQPARLPDLARTADAMQQALERQGWTVRRLRVVEAR